MLKAPHHTCFSTPSPASTYTRCTFAASGWRSVRNTLATTTPLTGSPTCSILSTASPSFVSDAAIASTSFPKSANSLSHECRIFMKIASKIANHWCTSRGCLRHCGALWPCDRYRNRMQSLCIRLGLYRPLATHLGAPFRSHQVRSSHRWAV